MGRRASQKEKTKTLHIRGPRSDWTTAARTVKRNELEVIATVCNTTVELVARSQRGVQSTGHYEQKNDVRNECTERERSSSGSTATATAESDERDSPSNHRL